MSAAPSPECRRHRGTLFDPGSRLPLVAVLGDIHDHRLLPAEQEVTEGGTEDHGHAQPRVVRHEDQHQQEAERHLEDVQERLEQVHRRQHRWWLFVDHLANHVNNAGPIVTAAATFRRTAALSVVVRYGAIPGILLRHGDGPVLERVVRLPEQMLAVVLEAFVERRHDEDEQHRPQQPGEAIDFPLLEQDRLVVAPMERHRHHVVHHAVHSAGTVPSVSRVSSGRPAVVYRVVLQTMLHRSVMAVVAIFSCSRRLVHQTVAIVVVFRVIHTGVPLLFSQSAAGVPFFFFCARFV